MENFFWSVEDMIRTVFWQGASRLQVPYAQKCSYHDKVVQKAQSLMWNFGNSIQNEEFYQIIFEYCEKGELFLLNPIHDINIVFWQGASRVQVPYAQKSVYIIRSSKGSILSDHVGELGGSIWVMAESYFLTRGVPVLGSLRSKNIFTQKHRRTRPKLNPLMDTLFMNNGILLRRLLFI